MKPLDASILAKLSKIKIHARNVVEGTMSGLHMSPNKGHSLEFSQHREYSYGDELRHIDWKVLGRSDKFFVKQFQDESNLRAYILIDASNSMSYTSGKRPSKYEYAVYIACVLSYLLLKQEDSVSIGVFDEKLKLFIPPRSGLSHLSFIIDSIEKLTCGGETAMENSIEAFGQQIKKRGLVILLSDLLAEPAGVINALKYIRYRHNEVSVLQILDPLEQELPFVGENRIVSLESNNELIVDADIVKKEYKKIFLQFLNEYKLAFRKNDMAYHLLTTDIALEKAISMSFAK